MASTPLDTDAASNLVPLLQQFKAVGLDVRSAWQQSCT